jgi:hypothetical protein
MKKVVSIELPEEVANMIEDGEELLTLVQMIERTGKKRDAIRMMGCTYHKDWSIAISRTFRLYRVKFWEER